MFLKVSHPGAGAATLASHSGGLSVEISFFWASEKKNEHEKMNDITANLLATIVRYLADFKIRVTKFLHGCS